MLLNQEDIKKLSNLSFNDMISSIAKLISSLDLSKKEQIELQSALLKSIIAEKLKEIN